MVDSCHSPVSLADAGINKEVEETGSTLEENAILKANNYACMSHMLTISDDSGLEVEALGGEPGVKSARYAGEGADDSQRIEYLLHKLSGVDDPFRSARFRCIIALSTPHGKTQTYHGECRGRVLKNPRGENGFGYDSVFLVEGLGKTMAELNQTEKNRVSHRGQAAGKATIALRKIARGQGLVDD